MDDVEELWKKIRDFPAYSVSNYGRVHDDIKERFVPTSPSNFGHLKTNLRTDYAGRHTRSVALLVAEAFCRPPDRRSDAVVILDGFLENVFAWNLAWRPRWFAWKYARQLRTRPHRYYETLPIINITNETQYRSVVDCGMSEGLLFDDIWRSTYSAELIYPHFCVYQVIK